jgi:uncharacterized UPF0146 family protein
MPIFYMPGDEKEFWNFVNEVLQIKGKKILDIGAGEKAQSAHKMIEYGGNVTILDNNKDRLDKQNIPGIFGDAAHIPLPDGSYDLVTTFSALHEMPAEIHSKVIREMKRVGKTVAIFEGYNAPVNEEEKKLLDLAKELASSVGEIEKPMPKEYWLSLLKESGIEAKSWDLELVFEENANEKQIRKGVEESCKSRGYPKDLTEAFVKQLLKVRELKGKESKYCFLILGL